MYITRWVRMCTLHIESCHSQIIVDGIQNKSSKLILWLIDRQPKCFFLPFRVNYMIYLCIRRHVIVSNFSYHCFILSFFVNDNELMGWRIFWNPLNPNEFEFNRWDEKLTETLVENNINSSKNVKACCKIDSYDILSIII